MEKKVALITGAGRGIGRACACALGAAGYRLVLVSRTEAELQETARLCQTDTLVLPADVSSFDQVQRTVSLAADRFFRIDAMVHAAGLAPLKTIEQMTVADWRATIDTNLSAAFYLARACWPIFRRQNEGVIVNISSLAGRDPFAGFAAYGAAKAGVNLLGLSLAREGAPYNIRVHTVAPGAVETAMFRQILSFEQYPTEKTLSPGEVADVVVHCVTGQLRYTSGEVIYVHKTA